MNSLAAVNAGLKLLSAEFVSVLNDLARRNIALRRQIAQIAFDLEASQLLAALHKTKAEAATEEIRTNTQWNPQCVACMATGVTTAAVHGNTGHLAFCTPCAESMAAVDKGVVACPVCRKPSRLVRIFQAGVSPFVQDTAV